MRKFNFLLLPLLALLPVINTGCAVPDAQIVQQADAMNRQLEPAVMTDPEIAGYLQRVGDRIIDTAKELSAQGVGPKAHFASDSQWMFGEKMRFHFVNSKTVNAFTTGGEHMYIYNELFQQAKSEDELAAVMAHEFAHIYGRHVGKGMQRQYTALAAAAALGGAGYLAGGEEKGGQYAAIGAGAGAMAGQFINMGFTRKDEDEADKYGFMFYTRAGWDPNKFAGFFRSMIKMGYDKTPAMLSDHPSLASRVEATERRVKELGPNASQWRKPPIANDREFAQLQRRAADLGKTLPSDQTIANSQELLRALPRSCLMPADPADAIQARESIAKKAEEAQQRSAPAQREQPRTAAPSNQAVPSNQPPPDQVISSPTPAVKKKKKPAAY